MSRPQPMREKWLGMILILGLGVCGSATAGDAADNPPSPGTFYGVDTGRLMGSPDPFPLEVERAFPRLRFDRPLEITHAGDGSGRVFVVEQAGVIHVFPNRPDVDRTTVFLDIRDVVSRDHNEEGLLGLAFHPRFKENGEFFVYYSTRPRASIVSRFRVSADDPNRADRNSEEILMHIPQPFGNHNGGSMEFGPDGYLYIGLGDGGSANDPYGAGQDLKTLLGKILRIDVDRRDPGLAYAIPKDNPFAGRKDGTRGEIWAYGLRNVWRLAFDRVTGDLFAGDVGQNRYEEIDLIVRGGNYGWKIREGFHPFEPNAPQTGDVLIDPLVEYFRHEGLSVTGGRVYRGSRLPEFYGAYFYADYVTGNVWILRLDDKKQVVENRKVARTGLNISAFGEDEGSELYFTAFDGYVYRLRKRAGDLAAIAAAFPRKLSETGLFRDTPGLVPTEGLLPYDVNVPLWSDGAMKQRYLALPHGRRIKFSEKGPWEFPEGTVLVKTFFVPASPEAARRPPRAVSSAELADVRRWRRLETRLLIHNAEGWQGYTYVWNDAQSDAELLDGAKTVEVQVATGDRPETLVWYFPSRSDCMACHTPAAGFVLGLNTRQLNRPGVPGTTLAGDLSRESRAVPPHAGSEAPRTTQGASARPNQIALWRELGVFADPPQGTPEAWEAYPDWFGASRATAAARQELVRAYLDANCAMCHVPNGIVGRPDFRFHTPLERAELIGVNPGQGRIGPDHSKLVRPGDPTGSELWHRLRTRGPRQMPPLASNRVDQQAVALVEQWILDLEKTWQAPSSNQPRRR